MNLTIEYVLNNIVFACAKGTEIGISGRQSLEGVHAVLCAKEVFTMIDSKNIVLEEYKRPLFEDHEEGKDLIK